MRGLGLLPVEPTRAARIERIELRTLKPGHVGLHFVADLALQISEVPVALGKLLQQILTWLTGDDAQKMAGGLDYVPLPNNIQAIAHSTLAKMHV